MRCEEARQLFDAYLDGELSGSLATELGAHRVHCAECRRALALLEVSGQIITVDRDPVALGEDFSDRLLACMEPQRIPWTQRLRRGLYIAVPLAAAAVIVLALVGVFDNHDARFAGEKGFRPEPLAGADSESGDDRDMAAIVPAEATGTGDTLLLEEWVERTRQNIASKRQSGESLQKYLDMTILQWIDILESAEEGATSDEHFPGADVSSRRTASEPGPPAATVPKSDH